MRLFVGIPLGDAAAEVARACVRAREQAPSWAGEKWVPEQNLHVTAVFLGEVPECELEGVRGAVSLVMRHAPAIALTDGTVQCRPSERRAGMIWIAYRDRERRCAALAGALADALVDEVCSSKPFRPHATLVRARSPKDARVLRVKLEEDLAVSARSVSDPILSLYASRLTPRGPQYSVVDSWEFNGG